MKEKSNLRFAIIGCGRIAERHAEHIEHLAQLVAVCDKKPERAKMFGDKHNCPYFNSVDEMLAAVKNIDIVSVCSPNGLHAEHSIKALNAGFSVLCEKPMATSSRDCERMMQTAEKANKRLFVIKQNRFNPPLAKLKEIVDEGRLGKILSVQLNCFWNRNDEYYSNSDWKGKKLLDGGTLFTQYSHFVDLLYWIVGDVKNVHAFTGNFMHKHNVEFEDTGAVILEFYSGAIGTINYTVNSYKKNMEGSITIFGEKGTIKVGGQYLNVLEYQNIEGYEIKDLPESGKANDYGFYQGSMSNHDKIYENVIDVFSNNAAVTTSALDGLKVTQIIEKIYEAANK
ncbi:MAG: Gfo/Idh/MocA family oxidoreductase [Bacteroidetes bacterium]|nr:Gfo/Idh/MocA family oxidoreductase [Bacteroidota bacterium]